MTVAQGGKGEPASTAANTNSAESVSQSLAGLAGRAPARRAAAPGATAPRARQAPRVRSSRGQRTCQSRRAPPTKVGAKAA